MISATPNPTSSINLAIASVTVHAVLVPVVAWITWKHGKKGLVCWPLLLSYLATRIAGDVYIVARRHEPGVGNTFTSTVDAGLVTCLTLALMGVVYEVNIVSRRKPQWLRQRIILGTDHLINIAGIGIASYGGTHDDSTESGIKNAMLAKVGHLVVVAALVMLCGWLGWTARHIWSIRSTRTYFGTYVMLLTGGVALGFHAIRVAHEVTFAFSRLGSLDPVSGSLATKLVLVYGAELCVVLLMIVGGVCGKNLRQAQVADNLGPESIGDRINRQEDELCATGHAFKT
ncbi:hypothetical protein LLEC1_02118 [Akanthomyces lecanii]|uniref:DUF7702 domain-containing protein n=1 Tax=Cordyceps confragosa TaxID=2714763 RepID=A0A179I352_CORDF|nr:hypothetical protein LLEC1_02118 [Akanthomyces lecanii]